MANDEVDARLNELLHNVTTLSDEELQELADLVLTIMDERGGVDAVPADELELLASAATAVRNEQKIRDERTPGRAARRTLDTFRAVAATANPHGTATVPEDRRPRFHTGGTARAVTASGHELADGDGVAREFLDGMRRSTSRDPRQDGQRVTVVTVHADRPHDRTLRVSDNIEVVTAALTAAAEQHASQALTAAGGFGAPQNADYSMPGFESTERPITSSLPTFTAERGGIRFIKPPTLADLADAVGIWTVPMDEAAATDPLVRKPSLRVSPNTEIVVDVQAVTNILTFGNMLSRAYPEYVERVIALAMAAHARIAEQQLLTQIGALSTAVSGGAGEGGNLGATRVLLPLLDRAATAMRDRLRTGATTPLQVILPHWARGILRTDLALQEPGDARLGTTDADLTAYLASRFLSPTWALDGEAGQQFEPQAAGAVNAWPTEIISYMFPAGAMQFLDGGTLDLGLIRDSTLNAANDYMMFSETFEAVAYRGGESLRIRQAVTPSGIARAAEVAA